MSARKYEKLGRVAEDETNGPRLPGVTRAQVAAVEDWLAGHRNVHRPLTVAAPLLAMICALYHKREYFPTRNRVAAWLRDEGYAEWNSDRPNAVDKALQAALALNEIQLHYRVEEGNGAKVPGVIRRRIFTPHEELLKAFDDATRGFGRLQPSRRRQQGKGVEISEIAALVPWARQAQ